MRYRILVRGERLMSMGDEGIGPPSGTRRPYNGSKLKNVEAERSESWVS